MEAFAEVFEDLRASVFSVAYRLVGPDEADDVVMETYLKAWRAIPRFNERSSLKTWLYRIAHNCGVDMIRARRRNPEMLMPEDHADERTIQDLPDDRTVSAPDQIIRHENAELVQRAVAKLDDKHRVTLLLRYADNLSYAEIAAATGVSLGTVMSRLYNGKRKLKTLISDWNE